jgi:hypothetical protein
LDGPERFASDDADVTNVTKIGLRQKQTARMRLKQDNCERAAL